MGRLYELTVDVAYYGPHPVEILFKNSAPETPRVSVARPATSPHRFDDNTLCMWFPWDDNTNKWLRRDGLLALVGHIGVHLFRENWWHEYGEWLGDEITHITTKDVARAS